MSRFKIAYCNFPAGTQVWVWALFVVDGEDEEPLAVSNHPIPLFAIVADINQNGVLA